MRFLRSRGDFFTIARSVVASAQEMCILREFTYKMSLALQGHENDVVITKLYTLFLLILAQLDERRGGQRRDGMTLLRILRHIQIALLFSKLLALTPPSAACARPPAAVCSLRSKLLHLKK